jgi:hypothetical protein
LNTENAITHHAIIIFVQNSRLKPDVTAIYMVRFNGCLFWVEPNKEVKPPNDWSKNEATCMKTV